MNWIKGYSAGCMGEQWSAAERPATSTFKPDNNITRAEVVTIVNRVTEREADSDYINRNMSTVNTFTDLKDKGYWAFYEIIEAANTHDAIVNTGNEVWIK